MIYKILLLLFVTFSQFAHAETVSATYGVRYAATGMAGNFATKAEACSLHCNAYASHPAVSSCGTNAYQTDIFCVNGQGSPSALQQLNTYFCPVGQNWTLSGSTCTRPDCVSPQVRNTSTGLCEAPQVIACPASGTSLSTGQFKYAGSGSFCSSTGCTAIFQGTWPTGKDSTGALYGTGSIVYVGGGNQGECTPSAIPTAEGAAKPTTDAPCAANEGVLTSTSGKVACVPSATPGSEPPKINKTSATKTFPDGSTQVTTNTQTCTGAGACSTVTTITNTGPTGATTTTGDAGKPGVSTEVKDKLPSETAGFCQQNPSLQICKGGMNEEATQKEVRDHLKSLTDPGSTNYDAVKNAKHSDESQTKLDDENKKFSDAASGTVDPTSSTKSAWASAMESGWFVPIPASSCAPLGGTIGNRTFSIDICPTAQKISVIVEYAMWFAFVVGCFVMFTGGKQS